MEIIEIKQLEMCDEDYFKYTAVSNSKMSAINPPQGGSIKRFFNGKADKNKSSALENGTYVHLGILEPNRFVVSDIEKPTKGICEVIERMFYLYNDETFNISNPEIKLDLLIEIAINDVKFQRTWKLENKIKKIKDVGLEYYDHLIASSNSIVMSSITYNTVTSAIDSVKKNCMYVLDPDFQSFNEQVIIGKCIVDSIEVPIKGKIDNYTIDYENKVLTLNDLKTTGFPIHGFMGYYNEIPFNGEMLKLPKTGNFQKNRYYRQIAFYLDLLCEYFFQDKVDKDDWTIQANIIVVETTGDFESGVFNISEFDINAGRVEYNKILKLIAQGLKEGNEL